MATEKRELEISIRARDLVTRHTKRIGEGMSKLGRTSRRAFDTIKRAAEGAAKAIRFIGRAVKVALGPISLLITALGALTGVGFAASILDTARSMDELQKTARQMGVSTQFLTELTFAMERVGVEAEVLSPSLEELSKRIGEFQGAGTGEFAGALELINQQQADLIQNARSTEEAFEAVLQVAQELDKNVRFAFLDKAFGGQGIALAKLTTEQLTELRAEARRLGVSFDERAGRAVERLRSSLTNLAAAIMGVRRATTGAIASQLSGFIDRVTEFTVKHREDFVQAFKDVATAMTNLGQDAFTFLTDARARTLLLDALVVTFAEGFKAIGELSGQSFVAGWLRDSKVAQFMGGFANPMLWVGLFKGSGGGGSEPSGLPPEAIARIDAVWSRLGDHLDEQAGRVGQGAGRALGAGLATGMVDGVAGSDAGAAAEEAARVAAERFQRALDRSQALFALDRRNMTESVFGKAFGGLADQEAARKSFEALERMSEETAGNIANIFEGNLFTLMRNGFRDFTSFAQAMFTDMVDFLLQELSRLFAAKVFQSLLKLFNTAGVGTQSLEGADRTPFGFSVSDGGGDLLGQDSSLFGGFGSSISGAAASGFTSQNITINAVDTQSFADALARNPDAVTSSFIDGVGRNSAARSNVLGVLG